MPKDSRLRGLHCPDCNSPLRRDGFNRYGWYYAECGRRFNPDLNEWDYDFTAAGCLSRRLQTAQIRQELAEKNAIRWRQRFQKAMRHLTELRDARAAEVLSEEDTEGVLADHAWTRVQRFIKRWKKALTDG